jgi:hypothetical protein
MVTYRPDVALPLKRNNKTNKRNDVSPNPARDDVCILKYIR